MVRQLWQLQSTICHRRKQWVQEMYMKNVAQVWGAGWCAKTNKGLDKGDYPVLALENISLKWQR